MLFQFPPAIQAGIAAGKYVQVISSTGVPLGMVREAATGHWAGHAVGVMSNGAALNPLLAVPQLAMGAGQMYQSHLGLQALKSLSVSVATLQATTAVIGVGVAAGVALSAVNLWQTLKLREDVKQLRFEVKDGFIDLKQALKEQGTEIKQLIEQVAQDVEFKHHRTILIQAYGRFIQAINCLRDAVKFQDANRRNAQIDLAKGMLFEALADYDNSQLLEGTCAAGLLRRRECAWAIEQAIAMTYQLQDAHEVVSDRLSHLQTKIRTDSLTIISRCESEEELDFLFPEITRIHHHDLAVLNSWQNNIDWMQTLSSQERHLLSSSNITVNDNVDSNQSTVALAKPDEQIFYEDLKQKSHFLSLSSQLQLMMQPDLHQEYASYISHQAAIAGYKTLIPSNLQQASDLAVANLYWYFKVRDESEELKEIDDIRMTNQKIVLSDAK
jgi:hypothetical protein